MNMNRVLDNITREGIAIPKKGTGKNHELLVEDLEKALGHYFYELKYYSNVVYLEILKDVLDTINLNTASEVTT